MASRGFSFKPHAVVVTPFKAKGKTRGVYIAHYSTGAASLFNKSSVASGVKQFVAFSAQQGGSKCKSVPVYLFSEDGSLKEMAVYGPEGSLISEEKYTKQSTTKKTSSTRKPSTSKKYPAPTGGGGTDVMAAAGAAPTGGGRKKTTRKTSTTKTSSKKSSGSSIRMTAADKQVVSDLPGNIKAYRQFAKNGQVKAHLSDRSKGKPRGFSGRLLGGMWSAYKSAHGIG